MPRPIVRDVALGTVRNEASMTIKDLESALREIRRDCPELTDKSEVRIAVGKISCVLLDSVTYDKALGSTGPAEPCVILKMY